MDSNVLYTVIIMIAFSACLYIQIRLLRTNRKGIKFIIPAVLLIGIFITWVGNEFDAIRCLPITIILLILCFTCFLAASIFSFIQKR